MRIFQVFTLYSNEIPRRKKKREKKNKRSQDQIRAEDFFFFFDALMSLKDGELGARLAAGSYWAAGGMGATLTTD